MENYYIVDLKNYDNTKKNEENDNFIIIENDIYDVFRILNPCKQKSTYWSNFLKAPRKQGNGWGIDYYLATQNIFQKIKDCKILMNIKGSDHCPVLLELK